VEQAEGLERGEVMRQVVGPALTEFMRPIYNPVVEPSEVIKLPRIGRVIDLPDFGDKVKDLLELRLMDHTQSKPDEFKSIKALNTARPELFFYEDTREVFDESIASGIAIPLTIATHIYNIEHGNVPNGKDDIRHLPIAATKVGYSDLTEIMSRDGFARILQRLTKGPNGFLGHTAADTQTLLGARFYGFMKPRDRKLRYYDVYRLEDGKVVDLSDEFHIAAEAMRKFLRARYDEDEPLHETISSSGCPVRHRFEDRDTGELQESLVVSSSKFLVAALEARSPKEEEA
jgi:hypothetical protein